MNLIMPVLSNISLKKTGLLHPSLSPFFGKNHTGSPTSFISGYSHDQQLVLKGFTSATN